MILNYVKSLAKDSLYYGVATGIRRFFSLFTAPIMTRVFSPSDYGVMDLITTSIAFATLIFSMGINGGVFRSYYEVTDSERKVLLFSGISASTFILSVFVALCIIFTNSISILLFETDQYTTVIRIALLQIPIVQLFDHYCTLLRYQKKVKQFMMISGVQISLSLFFLLFYVVYLKMGIIGVYLNIITSNMIPLLYLIVVLSKYYTLKFSPQYVKESLKFSIPLMPGWFIIMYLMQSNRFYLQAYHSSTEVGLYSIAARIAGIAGMLMNMFMLAWDPLSYKLISEKSKYYLFDSIARIFLFLVSVIILVVTFFAKEVLIILTTENYYSAYKIVGIIALGVMSMNFNSFIGMGIIISRKTGFKSLALAVGATVSTIIYIVLIPIYGVQAAAIGLLMGYIFSAIPLYYYSNKYCPIPYNVSRITGSYLVLLISVLGYNYFAKDIYFISIKHILIKLGIIFVISCILLITSFKLKEFKDLYRLIATGRSITRAKSI